MAHRNPITTTPPHQTDAAAFGKRRSPILSSLTADRRTTAPVAARIICRAILRPDPLDTMNYTVRPPPPRGGAQATM
ncbi:hypothetical protein E2C01_074392 [Portunus trituberculatus]|uniref:Uncharacterized protein n=1 Tax=Portunus trituberculatus TaxID=210409 RepID=A0A5B7I7W8_PORTR|nr:hypothetical protein [Portunus trituberculatus]